MKLRKVSKDGSPHVTDEVLNTISHMAGSIFALMGMVLLIVKSSIAGKPWHIVSFSIYGTALLFVFLASTLHHGIEGKEKVEKFFRLIDYLAIFPLIAGTYTPLCLIMLRNGIGWSVFGVLWFLVIVGLLMKSLFPRIPKWVTNTLYVCMGWVGAIIVIPLFSRIGPLAIGITALGGVFYTAGSIIFYSEKPNPVPGKFGFHEIWHIFVILGAVSHYFLMYFFVLPQP